MSTEKTKQTASASQNRAMAKDAALTGLPTLDPNDMPTAAQRRKWAKEYREAQDGALKLIPAAKKASAPETRKNDPNLNWAMYNPDKANPRTIPAEKPTAQFGISNDGRPTLILGDHRSTNEKLTCAQAQIESDRQTIANLQAQAAQLAEALRECQTQFGSLGYSQPAKYATKRFLAINEIAREALAAFEQAKGDQ